MGDGNPPCECEEGEIVSDLPFIFPVDIDDEFFRARGGGGSPTDTLGVEGFEIGICPLLLGPVVEYQASVIARVRSSYSNAATRLGEIIIVFDRLRSVFVGS